MFIGKGEVSGFGGGGGQTFWKGGKREIYCTRNRRESSICRKKLQAQNTFNMYSSYTEIIGLKNDRYHTLLTFHFSMEYLQPPPLNPRTLYTTLSIPNPPQSHPA